MFTYFVYILRCSDNSFYTGVTHNISVRLSQHQEGSNKHCYTYSKRPVQLEYLAEFTQVFQAIAWEKKVKRWSRAKKEALIRGDYDALPKLARNGYIKRIEKHIAMVRRAHHDNLYFLSS